MRRVKYAKRHTGNESSGRIDLGLCLRSATAGCTYIHYCAERARAAEFSPYLVIKSGALPCTPHTDASCNDPFIDGQRSMHVQSFQRRLLCIKSDEFAVCSTLFDAGYTLHMPTLERACFSKSISATFAFMV